MAQAGMIGRRRMVSTGSRGTSGRRARLYHIGRILAFAILAAGPALGIGVRSPSADSQFVIVALGDSLTAGYGLVAADAFPVRLESALRAAGKRVRVIDAGVSGDTTAGGRARLDRALADEPDAAIVQLGANDALRGIDPEETLGNLAAILQVLKERGVRVLLAGMLAPPNLGDRYAGAFNAVYPALAAAHDVPLYPFFLDGVAANPALNQADGVHPTAEGVERIVKGILPYVIRVIDAE